MNNQRFLLTAFLSLVITDFGVAQVVEGFNGSTFPPTGWTTSASSGTTYWAKIASNTKDGSSGAASSSNPSAGVFKHLTLSLDATGTVTSVSYYLSVSSVTSGTGGKLLVQAGVDSASLVLLRTVDLEDAGTFVASNTYFLFTDNIDGTLASGQTGAVDLRSQNPAFIRWTHQKTTGIAAACRLEDVFIENAAALPVQLGLFKVIAEGLSAHLRWSTASEINNYGFEIERRVMRVQEGTSPAFHGDVANSVWTRLGFVPGSGTSFSPKEYSYKDKTPFSGRYAYRLKQIDFDGTYEYYHAAEVEVGLMPKRLELFSNVPNPFNPTTSIGFTLPEDGHAALKVFNILGREVQRLFEGEAEAGRLHQPVFDAAALASGIYFSRLEYRGQVLVKKMILIR